MRFMENRPRATARNNRGKPEFTASSSPLSEPNWRIADWIHGKPTSTRQVIGDPVCDKIHPDLAVINMRMFSAAVLGGKYTQRLA